MRTYTDLEKIEEIELGIRITKLKIKDIQNEIKDKRFCDAQDKLEELHLLNKLIENSEYRIEALKLVW